MRVMMQKLNMVKYARSEADVEALKKKGFRVVNESLPDAGDEGTLPEQQPKKGRTKKDEEDGEPG